MTMQMSSYCFSRNLRQAQRQYVRLSIASLQAGVVRDSCKDDLEMARTKANVRPDARAETAAAASLLDTLDRATPSSMPNGVAVAKNPITVQNFCMLACMSSSHETLFGVGLKA